jgi:hypothetical protein
MVPALDEGEAMTVGDHIRWHREYEPGFYNNPAHETVWTGTIVEFVTPDLVKVRRDGDGDRAYLILVSDIKTP